MTTRIAIASGEALHFHGQHRWEVAHDGFPGIAAVCRAVDLAASRAEINAARFERIDAHGVAKDVYVAIFLREAFGEGFPFIATGATAIDAQFAIERVMLGIAFDGHDENC